MSHLTMKSMWVKKKKKIKDKLKKIIYGLTIISWQQKKKKNCENKKNTSTIENPSNFSKEDIIYLISSKACSSFNYLW